MIAIAIWLRRWDHRRLQRLLRSTRDAGVRSRTLFVLHAAAGKGPAQIADAVGYDPFAVLKVLHRYRTAGDEGLRDHCEDNGHSKVDDVLRAALATLVSGSPEDDGWARPTWTREWLAREWRGTLASRSAKPPSGGCGPGWARGGARRAAPWRARGHPGARVPGSGDRAAAGAAAGGLRDVL